MSRDDETETSDPHGEPEAPPEQDDTREPASPRKEKVLHTRIPAALDEALKGFARSMRVPVSNLVRVLLEDAVEVAHRATDKVAEAAERATERVAGATPPAGPKPGEEKNDPLAGVFGYQPLTLGIEARCANCGRGLDVGEEAFLGLRDTPGPRVFVCPTCLPKPKRKESTP